MINFEDQFRALYPDCRVEEEVVTSNLTRYRVFIGEIQCSESGLRELAFKYAKQDIEEGRLTIPPQTEQLDLW